MRIAITGARGRLGTAVTVAALAAGHEVVAVDLAGTVSHVDSDGVVDVTADVTDIDDLRAGVEGSDALVHLAAIASPLGHSGHLVHHNNVVGSYNALAAAVGTGITRICLASSINAIGGAFSRRPRYDYFPVDESHPTYTEDPYSLSKWIEEAQASSFARRHEDLVISSLRFHAIVDDVDRQRSFAAIDPDQSRRDLWGHSSIGACAAACLRSLTSEHQGHEVFYLVAPETLSEQLSLDLAARFYPEVPVVGDLSGRRSFFDSSKAQRLLGW